MGSYELGKYIERHLRTAFHINQGDLGGIVEAVFLSNNLKLGMTLVLSKYYNPQNKDEIDEFIFDLMNDQYEEMSDEDIYDKKYKPLLNKIINNK